MPTYEYLCHNAHCNYEFETFQSMKDDALEVCPECKQTTLKRKIGQGAGIIFKGSGFYETDYKRKSQPTSKSETVKHDSKASTAKAKKDSTSSTS